MSEGIIIALITAIGSLLGGIIGQIITANATVKAAAIKEKVNLPSEKPRSWGTIVGGALIGAIATLIVLSLLGIFPPPIQIPPTETASYPTPTSNPPTEKPIISSILFDEDFEDGKAQNLTPLRGTWTVAQDETGNFVYDVNNIKGNDYIGASFGSVSWKDYTISYRVKALEYGGQDSKITLYFRNAFWGGESYEHVINFNNRVQLAFWSGNSWLEIKSNTFNFGTEIWYPVKVDAYGNKITIHIGNEKIFDIQDTRRESGQFLLSLGPKTHAQFDDILVTTNK